MTYFRSVGLLPPKQHTVLRDSEKRYMHEEMFSTQGFSGPSSLVYRLNAPTRVLKVEDASKPPLEEWTPDVIRNRMFEVTAIPSGGDFLSARTPLLFNDDLIYSVARLDRGMTEFYRNSTCDELVLIAEGSGVAETTFGLIRYEELDLVYIPRGTTVRWLPSTNRQTLAIVEFTEPLEPPHHYRTPSGQFLERAPYHERDLRGPELQAPVDDKGEFVIEVNVASSRSRYTVERHPFDVVGWSGCFYPFAFSLRDFEPISGRLHQMPDMYQFLGTPGALVCALVPLRAEDHPNAAPSQPHHNNLDYDEINFRVCSTNPAVQDPRIGNVAIQPRAYPHGPRPGFELGDGPQNNPLFGLMIDARQPMKLTTAAQATDEPRYLEGWLD